MVEVRSTSLWTSKTLGVVLSFLFVRRYRQMELCRGVIEIIAYVELGNWLRSRKDGCTVIGDGEGNIDDRCGERSQQEDIDDRFRLQAVNRRIFAHVSCLHSPVRP